MEYQCKILSYVLTRRKNREPVGRTLRSDLESDIRMALPSLNQEISGGGSPSARQLRVTGSFLGTTESTGCSIILGGLPASPINIEKYNNSVSFIL